jgi:Domain of unknown function (DUF4148)
MRHIKRVLIISVLIGLPIASHATDVAPKTRAQVRAELIAAELSGQIPYSQAHYPDPQPDPASVYVARKAVSDTHRHLVSPRRAPVLWGRGLQLSARRSSISTAATNHGIGWRASDLSRRASMTWATLQLKTESDHEFSY